jgi:hypothetical protein
LRSQCRTRFSLRRNIGLTDGFIDEQKKFEKSTANFSNSEKISTNSMLEDMSAIIDEPLSPAVLWACNVRKKLLMLPPTNNPNRPPLKRTYTKTKMVNLKSAQTT